jgi:hypothetical protein
MSVYVDAIDELVPDKEYNQFRGPDLSDAAIKSRTLIVTIKNRNGVHSVANRVGLDGSSFPHSIAPGEVFGSNYAQTQADKQVWKQFMLEMSAGFDEGHLSIGGRVLSKKIEVIFSGSGIGPLLKDLIQIVEQ